MSRSVADKRAQFRALHERGCFAIPNPWDMGSAIALESLGFKALASTSAGFAWARGRADGKVGRHEVLDHLDELAAAVDIPVNADFEGGFAVAPEGVAESVAIAVRTGVAGLSIEDSTGDPEKPLYDFDLAVARVAAARAAIGDSGVILTGRSEGFIRNRPDLEETIRRLKAYAEAGAGCLYAPGVSTPEQIAAVVAAVAPKPVNVLAFGMPMAELETLGVRRVSVGGSLARAAWGGFLEAAREIADHGTFTAFGHAASGRELNALFAGRG